MTAAIALVRDLQLWTLMVSTIRVSCFVMAFGVAAFVGACTRDSGTHCGNRGGDAHCQERFGEDAPYCSLCEASLQGCSAQPAEEQECMPDIDSDGDTVAGSTSADTSSTSTTANDATSASTTSDPSDGTTASQTGDDSTSKGTTDEDGTTEADTTTGDAATDDAATDDAATDDAATDDGGTTGDSSGDDGSGSGSGSESGSETGEMCVPNGGACSNSGQCCGLNLCLGNTCGL
jgi:hypothetical protein